MKRQRGRGRKPGGGGHHHGGGGGGGGGGGNNPNRQLETNGPDTKFRGTASYIYERYLGLARDAASSGDRVMAENYSQHAEHYFRMLRAMQPAMPPPQQERFNNDAEFEGDEDGAPESEAADAEASGEAAEGEGEFAGGPPPQQQQQNFDRENGEGGEFRRRRNRRNRYRPDGEGGEAPREGEGGERQSAERQERPERSERPERRERAPRENAERGADDSREGFSNGPKPAFLRSE